jgi:hypothetical protein
MYCINQRIDYILNFFDLNAKLIYCDSTGRGTVFTTGPRPAQGIQLGRPLPFCTTGPCPLGLGGTSSASSSSSLPTSSLLFRVICAALCAATNA